MHEQPVTPRWRSASLVTLAAGILVLLAVLVLTVGPRVFAPRATATEGSVAEIQRVSLADAKAALDAGTAVFVDVREEASYSAGHIPGALSLPLDLLEQGSDDLDPQAWIITYCT